MKKTLSITIGGRISVIEDEGYVLLESYLNQLKQHFAEDPSREDLLADIELSIADKFAERLNTQKQVVTKQDVEEVIAILGRPEQIADQETDTESASISEDSSSNSKEETTTVPLTKKRLYRDPDTALIAGVCAGIAAYFGIDVLIVRVIFVLLAFLNGFGMLIYLILWIAIPRAETSAEKLAMQGKPLTVEEIEQLVREKAKKIEQGSKQIAFLPMRGIGALLRGISLFFRRLLPFVSIAIGLFLLAGSIIGVAFLTIGTALLVAPERIQVHSMVPLIELAKLPFYYLGLGAGYLLFLIPLIFVILLAVTALRRQNIFRVFPVVTLVALWIVSAGAFALSARDIGPWVYNQAQLGNQANRVVRQISDVNFSSLQVEGVVRVRVVQGPIYAIMIQGTALEADSLRATYTTGTRLLTLTQKDLDEGICVFCTNQDLEVQITMPELQSYFAKGATRSTIEGFSQNLDLRVQESARVSLDLRGQQVTTTIRDAARVTLTGAAQSVFAQMTDAGRIDISHLLVPRERVILSGQRVREQP